jgi:hypothetical protein
MYQICNNLNHLESSVITVSEKIFLKRCQMIFHLKKILQTTA